MGAVKYPGLLLILVIVSLSMGGCSSDSAAPASSGSNDQPAASYSGKSTEATVTSSNSEEISDASLDGAGAGTSIGSLGGSGDLNNSSHLISMLNSMRKRMLELDVTDRGYSKDIGAISNFTDTVTSSCGGSYTYNYNIDTTTGDYSGSYTYNEYVDCDDNGTTDGTITYSGVYNLAGKYFNSLKYTFSSLTYKESNESITMTGTFDLTQSSTRNYSFTMNMDFRDNVKNETFKTENYVVTINTDLADTYGDYTFAGKFYHSVHGFITLSTITTVRAYFADNFPTSGKIKLVGSGNSSILATFTSNNTYTLEIDSDGDSTYETTKNCTQNPDVCT